jgi:hypothetical protein
LCGEISVFTEEFFWKSQSAVSALSAVCRILKNSSAVFLNRPLCLDALVDWFLLLFA